jgi:hypothetical protein
LLPMNILLYVNGRENCKAKVQRDSMRPGHKAQDRFR